MDTWNTETTMHNERVPAWLVEFAQLWTCQSATNPRYHEEYQQIKHLANAADVPPFLIALRLFRDTYQVQPTTTWEQFHTRIDTQISPDGDQLLLHLDMLPPEETIQIHKAMDQRSWPCSLHTYTLPPHHRRSRDDKTATSSRCPDG